MKLEEQEVDVDNANPDSQGFGNDDPDSQIEYFQNPIHQHNRDVQDNNEPASAIITLNNRRTDPIAGNNNITLPVTLANATNPTLKQECVQQKKKKKEPECVEEDTLLEDETRKIPP
jgi:hypothetical protein